MQKTIWGRGIAFAMLALALGACSQQVNPAENLGATQCVDVPDGYYLFERGQFRPTSAPVANRIETIIEVDAPLSMSDRISATFAGLGFPWLSLNINNEVATLIGLAPTQDAKDRAYIAGEAAIFSDTDAAHRIRVVVDGISVEGGEAAVGAAVAELDARPTVEACQTAFTDTMEGRNVDFASGQATINADSARLLDAATGVALLCRDYNIEIGGHTDASGDSDANLRLSQRRATAVRRYLLDRSVAAETLSAIGYGETRPLDPAHTAAAYQKNRRTQFTVKER